MTVTQEALDTAQSFVSWADSDPEAEHLLGGQDRRDALMYMLFEMGCNFDEAALLTQEAFNIPRQREEL